MQRFHSVSSVSEIDLEIQPIAASQAVKPLPPLPRGWSRVCHETGLFLRGIGLGIVVTFFQGIFTKNFLEPQKIAIRRSRVTALLRTLIHLVPIGVAIFEIVLNFKGHFVGAEFGKQSYLQFAAKAHEIAMQASIATILLSFIRYQISAGKGMPFGAVLSGLQFLQVSYLWSVELWSSILSKDFQLQKKACFAVLILICIAVAATAGPSSATLLIPRQDLWPLTSSYLLVNASFLDLWPDRLDDKKVEKDCATVRLDSIQQVSHCPVSSLYTIVLNDLDGTFIDEPPTDSSNSILVPNSDNDVSRIYLSASCQLHSQNQFCGTTSQRELQSGYTHILGTNIRNSSSNTYQFLRKNYYQPYTIASCVIDAGKDTSDQAPLRFARISETGIKHKNIREIVSVPGLTKGQIINNLSGDNSGFGVDWVDLPRDVFSTGIPGAVIVNSRDFNSSGYSITTCTLNAGWGSSTISSVASSEDFLYTHTSNVPSSLDPNERGGFFDAFGYVYSDVPLFESISNFSYPQRHISVSKSWMEFLNPTVILANNSTANFISLALSLLPPPVTEAKVAVLFNVLVTMALAETGAGKDWKVFSDLKNATRTCDTCLVFEVENSVYGWLYSARGTTTILSITVMLLYCALVLGHIIYSAISGISSTAWDSTAEFVALAMNSSPTKILQNTCAGIVGRRALQTPVRVLATTPGHLELVFGEAKDQNAQISELVPNEKYGKVHDSEDDSEDEELEFDGQESLREGLLLRTRNKGKLGEGSDWRCPCCHFVPHVNSARSDGNSSGDMDWE